MPLYVFCGEDLLIAYLHPSNIDGVKHAWAILSLLCNGLRAEFPEAIIVFRSDTGFARPRLIRWCEKNNVNYVVGLPSNNRLIKKITVNEERLQKQYDKFNEEQLSYYNFQYAAKTWNKKRRVIARMQVNHPGVSRRFILTDLDAPLDKVYENAYSSRGDMENQIK